MLRPQLLGDLLGGAEPPVNPDREKAANKLLLAKTLLEQALNIPTLPAVWKLAAAELLEGLQDAADTLTQGADYGAAFYFGSLGGEHLLYTTALEPVPLWPAQNYTDIPAVIAGALDGGFLPDAEVEGRARVQVIEGWTVAAWHDRSMDRRLGSHSTFVFLGAFPAESGIAEAQRLWPTVFARYPFPVVLAP